MTKQEIIDKYGIQEYIDRRQRYNEYRRNKYKNDEEYRSTELSRNCINQHNKRLSDNEWRNKRNKQHSLWNMRRYVKDGRIELVENYELAKADNFEGWVIHHKDGIRELSLGIKVYRSKDELIENGRYLDCPPNELIWMTLEEHSRIHNLL